MKAWELLSATGAWCKEAFAKNISGEKVHPSSTDACSWCAAGALQKIYGDSHHIYWHTLRRAIPSPWEGVAEWNDASTTTQEHVIEKLKALDL